MRLESLTVGSAKDSPTHRFKCLKDVALDFGSGGGVTALVGHCGAGKSAALEALATLFHDLIRGAAPAFAYRIAYRTGPDLRRRVWIDADPDRRDPYRIRARESVEPGAAGPTEGAPLTLAALRAAKAAYLPRLIGYSSEPGPRPRAVFGPERRATEGGSSAGERQKRAVFGALDQADAGGCLILLDGPDTHLHPGDCAALSDRLAATADGRGRAPGQLVLATHQPLTVASLRKTQVRILRPAPDSGRVAVDAPDDHPQGMGVTGLLKSDLFGLPSTLDAETERRLLRRNALFGQSPRTPEEDAELGRLSAELADLGFSTADFRDPVYALFARKMAERRRSIRPALTLEERAWRDRIAGEIVDEILREDAGPQGAAL